MKKNPFENFRTSNPKRKKIEYRICCQIASQLNSKECGSTILRFKQLDSFITQLKRAGLIPLDAYWMFTWSRGWSNVVAEINADIRKVCFHNNDFLRIEYIYSRHGRGNCLSIVSKKPSNLKFGSSNNTFFSELEKINFSVIE